MNIKRMLFVGVLLSGVNSLWGTVNVVGTGAGDVVITLDGGYTTIGANVLGAITTIAGNIIIKGEGLLTTIN